MERSLSIPRQALADLLRSSGSALTPEAYLASLQQGAAFETYPSRATASWWSMCILACAAVLSLVWIPLDFPLESFFIVGLIVLFTVIEYRVHRGFAELNPNAPVLGFRNQSGFALAILVYGLYHAFAPLPASMQTLIDSLNSIDSTMPPLIKTILRIGYLTLGVVGGASQFALAWFYLRARGR